MSWMLAACGGGGSSGPAPVEQPPTTPAAPVSSVIRFEGFYQPGTTDTLAIRPLAGSQTIGTQPIARVEVSTSYDPPQVLAAANSTDAQGRPQFLFTLPSYLSDFQFRSCMTWVPLRITVTDTTGFAFAKNTIYCPAQAVSFGAFSDYGDRSPRYTGTAAQPANATLTRTDYAGYSDTVVLRDITSLNERLPAREGDTLQLSIGYPAASTPDGITSTARIEGDGGAFAESTNATNRLNFFTAEATLACCRIAVTPENAAAIRQVRIIFDGRMYNVSNPPPVEFDYHYRVTDSTNGAVVAERSGTATNYTSFLLEMRTGYQVALDATPRAANTVVSAEAQHAFNPSDPNASNLTLGRALSNSVGTPARLNVFCCSR